MRKLSVYIIAYNEIDKITAAIESVLWADEIIVADSGSTDGTAERATQLGAKVVQIPFQGFGDLRNQAVAACQHEWIFSLDSDERCTPEVRDEILHWLASDSLAHEIFYVPRRNFFMGHWIQHSGWYPNYRQPQFFHRAALSYDTDPVHEGFIQHSKLSIGHLQHAIWQMPFRNLEEVVHKANRYSSLGVDKIRHKKATMGKALRHGIWAFIKHYVFKRGFLDGWAGFVIAFGNFEGTFYRYAKLYEQQQQWQPPSQAPITRPSATETRQ